MAAMFALASSFAHADASGRVRSLYFEAARGVLVDRPVSSGTNRRWAEVEIDGVDGERRHVLAKVPGDMPARVGDMVAVEIGSGKLREWIPVQRETRVTALNASSFAGNDVNGFSGLR